MLRSELGICDGQVDGSLEGEPFATTDRLPDGALLGFIDGCSDGSLLGSVLGE